MRLQLKSNDIINDRNIILSYSINLLYSIIDILSTLQILNGVLITIELCQMIIQSMWDNDNYLLQLPYLKKKNVVIFLNKQYNINNIYDLLEMDDNKRIEALNKIDIGNDQKKLNHIALVCNQYSDLDLNYKILSNHDDYDFIYFFQCFLVH